ncbi:MAG: hypothetical protein ACJ8GN_02275 [Longimicrobiaceae bacterium]
MTVGEAVDFEESFGAKLREALREKLSAVRATLGGPVFEAAVDKVVEQAARVLDAPIADLLTAAWARYPEVQELCDARRQGGDHHEAMAELCEHRFEWAYEPRVEVVVNEIPISIPLGVGVGLAVAGGVLVVQGGKMKELRSGKLALDVRMAVAEKEVARQEKKVALPRVLHLGDASPPREAVPVGRIAAPAEPVVAAKPALS